MPTQADLSRPSWAVMGPGGPSRHPSWAPRPTDPLQARELSPQWVCPTCAGVRPPDQPCHPEETR